MAQVRHVQNGPYQVGIRERITHINYKPTKRTLNKEDALNLKFKIKNVVIQTRFIEGPIYVEHEENGVVKKKHRYHVLLWPEKKMKPTKKFFNYLRKCESEGIMHIKARLWLPDNVTCFHHETAEKKCEVELPSVSSTKIIRKKSDDEDKPLEVILERVGPNCDDPSTLDDLKTFMSVVEWRSELFYESKFIPRGLSGEDIKSGFWKIMRKPLGFKEVKVDKLVFDLDIESFIELKKIREAEFFNQKNANDKSGGHTV